MAGQSLAIAAMSSQAALAQSPRTIHITDQQNAPIALAEVAVVTPASRVVLTSDENGDILLDEGIWDVAHKIHLTISAPGYDNMDVDVDGGAPGELVFQLRSAKSDEGGIVVVGRRISRPFSPLILAFQDIVTDAKAQADPILAVNNLPSSTNVTGNARLTLRGSRASINRAYLNDVPVYEFTTGSELDDSTQNRSIFGLTIANEVEAYPGNPPAYLAGATGGVVRLTSPDNKARGGVFSINDFGLGAGQTIAGAGGDDFLSLYGSLTDFSIHKAINPDLDRLYRRIRSVSGGALARHSLANGGDVTLLLQAEIGDDIFPFSLFGADTDFRLKPVKGRVIVNGTTPAGDFVIRENLAYTYSRAKESFGGWEADSSNRYAFASLDLSRGFFRNKLVVRIGADGESIRQTSLSNSGLAGSVYLPAPSSQRLSHVYRQVTGYAFATVQPSASVAVSMGARLPIAGDLHSLPSFQVSGTLASADRKHKLILSAGRYSGAAVPTRAYFGAISRSVSRQVEFDYSTRWDHGRLGVNGYLATERSDGLPFDPGNFGKANFTDNLTGIARSNKSRGMEVYAELALFKALEAKLSFTAVDQTLRVGGTRVRGANDFPNIIRASLRYAVPPSTSLSMSLTRRAGQPYTRAEGFDFSGGTPAPVYGTIGGARLPPYFSLDAGFSHPLKLGTTFGTPLFFGSVSNVLNRRNPSSQALTFPILPVQYRYLQGRTLSCGLIWTY
jgi:hypothetical protein